MILSTKTLQLFVEVTAASFDVFLAAFTIFFFGEFFFKNTTLASVLNKLIDFKCTFSPERFNWSPLAFNFPNFTVFTKPDSSSIIFQLISFTSNSVKAKSKVSALDVSVIDSEGVEEYKRKFMFPPLSINLFK